MTSFSPTKPFIGSQRNDLRKLARNHPDFDRWRAINDPKNEMKKAEIIKAINDLGLVDEANVILSYTQALSAIDLDALDDARENAMALPSVVEQGLQAISQEVFDNAAEDDTAALSIDSDIERVLGPIKPFLAAGLVATIESALRPIVVQAHKPAQTIVQAAPVVLKAGEAPHAQRAGQTTMAKAFMVGGAKGKKVVQLWNDPLAPRKDPGYVMDGAAMYLAASAFEQGETVWFAGPAGAGKTTRAKEYAAITGRGFVRIGFNHSTEMIDLI